MHNYTFYLNQNTHKMSLNIPKVVSNFTYHAVDIYIA